MEDLRFLDFEISAHAGREDLVDAHIGRLRDQAIKEHEELEYVGVEIERSLDYPGTLLREGRLKFRVVRSA